MPSPPPGNRSGSRSRSAAAAGRSCAAGLREAMGTRYELACGDPADSMLPQLARTLPATPRRPGHDRRRPLGADRPPSPGRDRSRPRARGGAGGTRRKHRSARRPSHPADSAAAIACPGRHRSAGRAAPDGVVLGVSAARTPSRSRCGSGPAIICSCWEIRAPGAAACCAPSRMGCRSTGVRAWVIDPRRSLTGSRRRPGRAPGGRRPTRQRTWCASWRP